jgi:hypothetical protein
MTIITANEHFGVPKVTKEDVINVANSIGITLTEAEINWAILCYEDAQRQDPSGTWNLVVEDLIYQAVEFRKPGTFDQLGYEQTQPEPGDDDYFDDSEERRDFGNDDDVNLSIGEQLV